MVGLAWHSNPIPIPIQFPNPVNPTKSVASDQIRLGAG